jgi:septum site-determining protein MinC
MWPQSGREGWNVQVREMYPQGVVAGRDGEFSCPNVSGRNLCLEGAAEKKALFLQRTLRSGQRVRYDGSIVILGDVNPGAEVVASGDIIILGALRGVAHAGATGDPTALVAALQLHATQLRIASCIGRRPDGDKASGSPEIARVQDGIVIVNPYLLGA